MNKGQSYINQDDHDHENNTSLDQGVVLTGAKR